MNAYALVSRQRRASSATPEFELFIYFNRHIRADESAKHASGAIFWFDHTSGVVSGGAEVFSQANHLVWTSHYAQLTAFASFFIHLYFGHENFSFYGELVEPKDSSYPKMNLALE
jgi:hypothetical protein